MNKAERSRRAAEYERRSPRELVAALLRAEEAIERRNRDIERLHVALGKARAKLTDRILKKEEEHAARVKAEHQWHLDHASDADIKAQVTDRVERRGLPL